MKLLPNGFNLNENSLIWSWLHVCQNLITDTIHFMVRSLIKKNISQINVRLSLWDNFVKNLKKLNFTKHVSY